MSLGFRVWGVFGFLGVFWGFGSILAYFGCFLVGILSCGIGHFGFCLIFGWVGFPLGGDFGGLVWFWGVVFGFCVWVSF